MHPYEHLMQKRLLYKYPRLGILLVLPPNEIPAAHRIYLTWNNKTHFLVCNYNPDLLESLAHILLHRSLGKTDVRKLSTCFRVCSFCCSNTAKSSEDLPVPMGIFSFEIQAQVHQTSLKQRRAWWKCRQYALSKFSSGNPRSAARVGFHDPEQPSKAPAIQESTRLHFCLGVLRIYNIYLLEKHHLVVISQIHILGLQEGLSCGDESHSMDKRASASIGH